MLLELPYITSYDPITTSEGSLDPLGLYLIADRLATKLAPGVRERMTQPRYLTAMALGAHICHPFYSEYADDGFTPAYQVYEWHIVEGFVSKYLQNDPDQIQGLPGIQKATEALQNHLPLRSSRYLKTANVFGFHGVYRTLSTELKVVSEDYIIQEIGHELLLAWQEEQKLHGVYTGNGAWIDKVKLFRNGVNDSMNKAEVARNWYWEVHQEFASYLRPNTIEKKEAQIILKALSSEHQPFRKQMIDFLKSTEGQNAWRNQRSEKQFMQQFKNTADQELKQLLEVIDVYEHFARCFQDAFDSCLHQMSINGKANHNELAEIEAIKRASTELPIVFSKIEEGLAKYDMHHEFIKQFGDFETKMHPKEWVMQMWIHHNKIQKAKGKVGKRNWFERSDDGQYRVYKNNEIHKPVELSNEYLHNYRAIPLWSFLVNLKVVKDGQS